LTSALNFPPASLSAEVWCTLAAATTGAAVATDAQTDAATGAARVLAAVDRAAAHALAWNTPLLPFGPVLQARAP
jgi:hypothetical protein